MKTLSQGFSSRTFLYSAVHIRPAYPVGTNETDRITTDGGLGKKMSEKMVILALMISLMVTVTKIIRALLDHLRRGRTERVQAEMYNKTLDKLSAGQEVLAYLQSDTGSKVFRAVEDEPAQPAQPYNRIMNAFQSGAALAVLGGGLLVLKNFMTEPSAMEALLVIGSVSVFAGLALLASGASAWILARKFGLINGELRNDAQGDSGKDQ